MDSLADIEAARRLADRLEVRADELMRKCRPIRAWMLRDAARILREETHSAALRAPRDIA